LQAFFLITRVSRAGSVCRLSGSYAHRAVTVQNRVQKWRDSSGLSRQTDEEWRTGSAETNTRRAVYVLARLPVWTPCPMDVSSHGDIGEMCV